MRHSGLWVIAVAFSVILGSAAIVAAEQIFLDVFTDGELENDIPKTRDGTAVHWSQAPGGDLTVQDGDFVASRTAGTIGAAVTGLGITDTSFRARLSTSPGTSLSLLNRWTVGGPTPNGYFAYLDAARIAAVGISGSSRADSTVLRTASTPLDATAGDVLMQFDVIGNSLSLWLWSSEDRMPEMPLLTVDDNNDDRVAAGDIGFQAWGEQVRFRYVQVGSVHILDGDLNADGILGTTDIDQLTRATRDIEPDLFYDLDGDDIVNSHDRLIWVHDIAHTCFGDSNLDGEFNSGDLVQAFEAGEYDDDELMSSGWGAGDWNGDGEFDSGDLVLAFQDGCFEQGPRANSIPEPHSLASTLLALLLVGVSSRSHLKYHASRHHSLAAFLAALGCKTSLDLP